MNDARNYLMVSAHSAEQPWSYWRYGDIMNVGIFADWNEFGFAVYTFILQNWIII